MHNRTTFNGLKHGRYSLSVTVWLNVIFYTYATFYIAVICLSQLFYKLALLVVW